MKIKCPKELYNIEHDKQKELIKKYGKLKINKKIYCKYCYENVKPQINWYEGLIQCSECNYGLAQIRDVIEAGSYEKYREKIELDFARFMKYLDEIRKGTRKSDGKDEFGIVPYICPICKKREITVHSGGKEGCDSCLK